MDTNGNSSSRLPPTFKNFKSSLSYLIRDTENNLAQGVYGSTDALAAAQPYAPAPADHDGHQLGDRGQGHARSASAFVHSQPHSQRSLHSRAPSSPPLSSLDAQARSRSVSPPPSMPAMPAPRAAFAFPPPSSVPLSYPPAAAAAAAMPMPGGSAIPAFAAHAHLADSLAHVSALAQGSAEQVAQLYATLSSFKTKMRAAFDSNMHTLDKKVRLVRRDILGHISATTQELEQRMLEHLRSGVLAAAAHQHAATTATATQAQSPHEQAMSEEFRRHATEELLFLKSSLGKLQVSLSTVATDAERRVRAAEQAAQHRVLQANQAESAVADLAAAQVASEKEAASLRSELLSLQAKIAREGRQAGAEAASRAVEQGRVLAELRHLVDNLVRKDELSADHAEASQASLLAHVTSAAQAYIDEQALVTTAMVKGLRRQLAMQQEELERLRSSSARSQPSKRGLLLSSSTSAAGHSMGSFAASSAAGAADGEDDDADDAAYLARHIQSHSRRLESLESQALVHSSSASDLAGQVETLRSRLLSHENESRLSLAQMARNGREEQSRLERDLTAREGHARAWREEMNQWCRGVEGSIHQLKFSHSHGAEAAVGGGGGGSDSNNGAQAGLGSEAKLAALEEQVRHLASLVAARPAVLVAEADAAAATTPPVHHGHGHGSQDGSSSSSFDLSSQILALERAQTQLQTRHFQLEAQVSSTAAAHAARADHLASRVAQLAGGTGGVVSSPIHADAGHLATAAAEAAEAACARLGEELRLELSVLRRDHFGLDQRVEHLETAQSRVQTRLDALGEEAERQGAAVQELRRAQQHQQQPQAHNAAPSPTDSTSGTTAPKQQQHPGGPVLPRTVPAPSASLAAAAAAAGALADCSPSAVVDATADRADVPVLGDTLPEVMPIQVDAAHPQPLSQHETSKQPASKRSMPAVPSTIKAPAALLAAAAAGSASGNRSFSATTWLAQPLHEQEGSDAEDRASTSTRGRAQAKRDPASVLGAAAAAALSSVLASQPSLRSPASTGGAAGSRAAAGSPSPSGGSGLPPRSRSRTPRSMSPVSSGATTPTATAASAAAAAMLAAQHRAASASAMVSPSAVAATAATAAAAAAPSAAPQPASAASVAPITQQQQQQHQHQQHAQSSGPLVVSDDDDDEEEEEDTSSSESDDSDDSESEHDQSSSHSSDSVAQLLAMHSPPQSILTGPQPSSSPDLSEHKQRHHAAATRGEMRIPAEVAAHVARGPSPSAEAAAALAATASACTAGAATTESDEGEEEEASPKPTTPRTLDLLAQAVKKRYQDMDRSGQVDGTAPLDEESLYDAEDSSAQGSAPPSRRGTVSVTANPAAHPAAAAGTPNLCAVAMVSPTAAAVPAAGAPKLHMQMAPLDLSEASAAAEALAHANYDDEEEDDESSPAAVQPLSPLSAALSPKPKLSAREQKFQALMARHQKLSAYKRVVTPPSAKAAAAATRDDASVPSPVPAPGRGAVPAVQRAASVGGMTVTSASFGGGMSGRGAHLRGSSDDSQAESDLDLSPSASPSPSHTAVGHGHGHGHARPSAGHSAGQLPYDPRQHLSLVDMHMHMPLRDVGRSPSPSPSPSDPDGERDRALRMDPELDHTEMDESELEQESLHAKFRAHQAAKMARLRAQAQAKQHRGGARLDSPVSPATEYARVHQSLQQQQQQRQGAQVGSEQWGSDDSEYDQSQSQSEQHAHFLSGAERDLEESPPAPALAGVVAAVGGLKLLAPFATSSLGGGGGIVSGKGPASSGLAPLASGTGAPSAGAGTKSNLGVTMPQRGLAAGGAAAASALPGFLKAPLGAPKAAPAAPAPAHSPASLRPAAASVAVPAQQQQQLEEDDEFDFEDDDQYRRQGSGQQQGEEEQTEPDDEGSADLQSSLSADDERLGLAHAPHTQAQSRAQGRPGSIQTQPRATSAAQGRSYDEDVEVSEEEDLSSPRTEDFADESSGARQHRDLAARPGQGRASLPQLQTQGQSQSRRSPLGSAPLRMLDHHAVDDDDDGLDSLFETTALSPAASPAARHGPAAAAGGRRRGQATDADDAAGVGSLMSELDSMDISASGADFGNSF